MKILLWFIMRSFYLDYRFWKVSSWSPFRKGEFLFKKYWLLFKHYYRRFALGKHWVRLSGIKVYYDSKFGLVGYQSLLARHQYLMQLAGVKRAEVVVDIGANVGFFSLLCRSLFPEARLYAFEPVPKIFDCLKRNFETDKNVVLSDTAISDTEGETVMNFDDTLSSISHFSETGNISVKTETLDTFVQRNNIERIDVLKIDVESFEDYVLRGAKYSLAKTDVLFMEVTIENNKNYTISSLLKMLATDEYDFQLMGFRNYADTSEGEMSIMDAVFKNIKIRPRE